MFWTRLAQWLPGNRKNVPDSADTEMLSRLVANLDGFETVDELSAGGSSFSTFPNHFPPFFCSPRWDASFETLNVIQVGTFRETEQYNQRDYFILRSYGDVATKKVVDQTTVKESVTITGKGVVFYSVMWDGTFIGVPVITLGFELESANPFLFEANDERKQILCHVDIDADGGLLYIRQTQQSHIDLTFHQCCAPLPTPGDCPTDCADCEATGPVTLTFTGFTETLCENLNDTADADTTALKQPPECIHFFTGSPISCPGPAPVCGGDPFQRGENFGDGIAVNIICCLGLWEATVYYADQQCGGFRSAKFFAAPDAASNGCVPRTASWSLASAPEMGVCQSAVCVGCTICCDNDCLQCTVGGKLVTT